MRGSWAQPLKIEKTSLNKGPLPCLSESTKQSSSVLCCAANNKPNKGTENVSRLVEADSRCLRHAACLPSHPEVIGAFFCLFILTMSYYLMTSKVTAKASVLFTTTCAFGMLVSLLQSIGIIGGMTVEFPINIKGLFSFMSIFVLDLESFGFACFAGANTAFRYSVSVVLFPIAVGWLALNFGASLAGVGCCSCGFRFSSYLVNPGEHFPDMPRRRPYQ